MKHCPKCQRSLANEARFCMYCGATVEDSPVAPPKQFCANCGTEVTGKFCAFCGNPAGTVVPVAPLAPEPATVLAPAETVVTPVSAPKRKGQGGLIAAIISVVLVLVLGLAAGWAFGLFGEGGLLDQDDRRSSARSDLDAPAEIEDTEHAPEKITLTVWAPQEDQIDSSSWLWVMLKKFEQAHPEYEITWIVQVCSEGDAATKVTTDVVAAADVYMYANDQLGILMQAGALTKLGGDYLAQVKNDNSATFVDTVTYTDGGVYGFPYTSNTWFMYYDKSVYSEEDIKSLESMLAKGKVAFPLSNSWYLASFYVANGCTLFGPAGNIASAGFDFGGSNAVAVTNYLVDLVKNPNFVCGDEWNNAQDIQNGTITAFMSGSWSADFARSAMGENFGAAPLPTVTIDGQTKQLRSFAGSKAIGVNPNCAHPRAAMQLAAFLSSEEAQLLRYEMRGVIPAASALTTNATIARDPVTVAQMLTMQNTSIVQPTIPQMGNYWGPAGDIGWAIVNGEVTHNNAEAKTKAFNDCLNNG